MSEKTSQASGGIGFAGMLQIVFITLKLIGVLNWKWWQVMLPFEILFGLILLVIVIIAVSSVIKHLLSKKGLLNK